MIKPKRPTKSKTLQPAKLGFDGLLRDLREFITESRRQVLRAVDVVQVRLELIREQRLLEEQAERKGK